MDKKRLLELAGVEMPAPEHDVPEDHVDMVTMDVPLLIRLMEWAREDSKDDMELHDVAEKLVSLTRSGKKLSMEDYDSIVKINNNLEKM